MQTLIFGNRDAAALARFYLTEDSEFNVVAFVVDGDYLKEKTFESLPIIPFEEINTIYPPRNFNIIIPILDNRLRKIKYQECKKMGYNIINYVSSKATIWSPIQGENCFILEDNTIQPFVSIGNNIIMWSGNHIGHHSKIEDNVFISSHVVISGHCTIEDSCWLGVNSTIRDGITIKNNTIIGMGSCVTKDAIANKTYFGNPAKCT